MKRRILCGILALLMLISLIPVTVLSAETAVSETENGTQASGAAFDYRDFYVKDGLTLLLDAFVSTARNDTIDLANGKWYSAKGSLGSYAATIVGVSKWTRSENGRGFGYTLTGDEYLALSDTQKGSMYGLDIGIAAVPSGAYTLEYIAAFKGLTNADGTRYVATQEIAKHGLNHENGFTVGPLKQLTMPAERTLTDSGNKRDGVMEQRWLYRQTGSFAAAGYTYLISVDHLRNYATTKVASERITLEPGAENWTYKFYSDGALLRTRANNNASFTVANEDFIDPSTSDGGFRLFFGMPATVYSVRMYNRVLTEAELAQNHFADVAGYYALDLSKLVNAPLFAADEGKALLAVVEAFKEVTLCDSADEALWQSTKAALQAQLDSIAAYSDYRAFYVKSGLSLLLDAFTGSQADFEIGKWYSSTGDGKYATLRNGALSGGHEWSTRQIGTVNKGIGFYETVADALVGCGGANGWAYSDANTPGLDLGYANLPAEDYTIETVLNPHGVMNDDLTARAYYQDAYLGLFGGHSIGPLKAWTFPSVRNAVNETALNRWYYTTGNGSSGVGIAWDTVFYTAAYPYAGNNATNLAKLGSVVSYAITFALNKNDSEDTSAWSFTYNFYNYLSSNVSKTIAAGSYIANGQVDSTYQRFHLMDNYPAIFYSVRVYDRVLTETERTQNHFADIAGLL